MQFNLISDLDVNSRIDLNDRGVHYGDGLFETMLLQDGEIKYWNNHYSRLQTSALKLKINCPEKAWFENNFKPYIALNKTLILKVLLNRGTGGRGLHLPEELSSNVLILQYEYKIPDKLQVVSAITSSVLLPINRNLAGLKHLNRLDYILASDDLTRFPDANEAILLDHDGYVIEGIINNLFYATGDDIYTPSLETSGVDGIMRGLIIEKLLEGNRKVNITRFKINDLLNAGECFMCNSVQGIRPITQIDNTHFKTGPLTQSLLKKFSVHAS